MMKSFLKKLFLSIAGMLVVAAAQAHPGSHTSEGVLSGIAHLLGEHGYLLMLLLGVGVILMRRSGRI